MKVGKEGGKEEERDSKRKGEIEREKSEYAVGACVCFYQS